MKVLVAIDNKPSSQAILDALVKMRWYEGTEISLLTVIGNAEDTRGDDAPAPDAPASAVEEVESLVAELHDALPSCEVKFFAKQGNPQSVILEFSEQIGADLIVIGSNCQNSLERL